MSCERVFNPKLRNRPVIVLSNNDGCAVARSNEVKQLGIPMGAPLFTIKHLVRKHRITVLSSNFSIYGNLSARIMHIIQSNAPQVEVYSVDEAFIDLSGIEDQYNFCVALGTTIERCTGVPVSIGIAPTHTLAKVANSFAKKQVGNRVFLLNDTKLLQQVLVGDVWGIGPQLQKRLHAIGIFKVGELINLPDATIKELFNVVMLRTVYELRGISCIELQDQTVNKDQIMVSRSFGKRVTDLAVMQEAIATHASSACVKLRQQKLVCKGIQVFLHTSLHIEELYKNARHLSLPSATSDTRVIIQYAKQLLKDLFLPGYPYKKVGIILTDLSYAARMQLDLFEHQEIKRTENLMRAVDRVNHLLGRNTLQFAAAGLHKEWQMRSENRTQNYTGDWNQLPVVQLENLRST